IEREHNKDFILLTLTYKRVPGNELSDTIDKFQTAFNRMFNRKRIKEISKGYVKKLEITYDNNKKITKEMYKRKKKYYDNQGLKVGMEKENYDTYNVHNHVIVAVNKTKNKKNSKRYEKKLKIKYDKNKKKTKEMNKRKKKYYDNQGLKVGMENENYDTYHVHYHVLVAVNKSYFKKKNLYLRNDEW